MRADCCHVTASSGASDASKCYACAQIETFFTVTRRVHGVGQTTYSELLTSTADSDCRSSADLVNIWLAWQQLLLGV